MYRLLFFMLLLQIQIVTAADIKYINPQVKLETEKGDILIELFPKLAPVTVDNFIQHVNDYHYDGLIFHRVMRDFMIQTGGFTFDFTPRETIQPSIVNESKNGLKNLRGTISMARLSEPNSAKAQFFINHKDNSFLDSDGQNFGYAVFGKVIRGMQIVHMIATVKTTNRGPYQNVPIEPIRIIRARLISSGSWIPSKSRETSKPKLERPTPLK